MLLATVLSDFGDLCGLDLLPTNAMHYYIVPTARDDQNTVKEKPLCVA